MHVYSISMIKPIVIIVIVSINIEGGGLQRGGAGEVVAPWEIRAVTVHYGALFLRLSCLPGLCCPLVLGLAFRFQVR